MDEKLTRISKLDRETIEGLNMLNPTLVVFEPEFNDRIDQDILPKSIEKIYFGIKYKCYNMLGLDKLTIVDPCPVIAVVGGRKSYTQYHEQVAKFNAPAYNGIPVKFLEGIKNKNKYFIDDKNYLRFR